MAGRWARALLFEDWSLKLLALVITLGLWYGVTGQRTPATIRLHGVPLVFLRPDDLEISNDPRDNVEITLHGSKRALDTLNARDLVASVDLRSTKPGEHVVSLTPETVTIDFPNDIRNDVQIERIEPGAMLLRLEPRVQREVDVEAQFVGKPAAGYEVLGVQITPSKVRVRGPESRVEALGKLTTEAISLDGRTESFSAPQTAVNIDDRTTIALDAFVDVRVEIGEQRVEKRFSNVPVRFAEGTLGTPHPARVDIIVRGPRSSVANLRAADISIVLDKSPDGMTMEPHLSLPGEVAGQVELVSTDPPLPHMKK